MWCTDMNDRELLEYAAKAAGIEKQIAWGFDSAVIPYWVIDSKRPSPRSPRYWNPLTDDGDALRMARVQSMTIAHEPSRGGWSVGAAADGEFKWLAHDDDQNRAIVRAAAEIGKVMK